MKIGKGAPDWTLGFNLAVAWKGIDLGAFFNATIGNDIFDASYRSDYPYLNMPRHMLDRWTGPGSSNRIPRLSRNVDAANWQSSDLYVHDGSFLRLRSLQLGYSFPAALLRKVHIERRASGSEPRISGPDFVRRFRSGNLLRRDLAGC